MSVRWLAWSAAGAAVAAVSLLRALDGDHTTAYRIGAFIGAVLGSLLLALAIVWVFLRLARRRDVGAWSPWVPALAAAIGLVVLAGANRDDSGPPPREVEAALECDAPDDVFGEPPEGMAYEPLDPAIEAELRSTFPLDGRIIDRMATRAVMIDREQVGTLVALPIGDTADDFDDGFEAGAERQGVRVERIEVDGTELVSMSGPDGFAFAGAKGCTAVAVYAFDAGTADALPRAVFGDG